MNNWESGTICWYCPVLKAGRPFFCEYVFASDSMLGEA